MESDHLQQFLAEIEERICTCGAGHGSGEGHTDWCEWVEAASAALTAAEQAEPAPAARSGAVRVKQSALGYYEISKGFGSGAYYTDEVLWCETCGERPQEVRTEHAGLCRECWVSEGRPE